MHSRRFALNVAAGAAGPGNRGTYRDSTAVEPSSLRPAAALFECFARDAAAVEVPRCRMCPQPMLGGPVIVYGSPRLSCTRTPHTHTT